MAINFQSEDLRLVWAIALNCEDANGATQILRWCGPSTRTSGFTVETGLNLGAAYEPRGGTLQRRRDLGGLKNSILIPTEIQLKVDLGEDDGDLRSLAITGNWAGHPFTAWRVELDDQGLVLDREIIAQGRITNDPTVTLDSLSLVCSSTLLALREPWPMGRPIDTSLFTDTTDGVTSMSTTAILGSMGGTFHPSAPGLRAQDAGRYIPLVFGDEERNSGNESWVVKEGVFVGENTIYASKMTGVGVGGAVTAEHSYFFYCDPRVGSGAADSLWVDQVWFEAPDTAARPHTQQALLNDGGVPGTGPNNWLASGGYLNDAGLFTVYEVLDATAGIGPVGLYVRVTSDFDIDWGGDAAPRCMVRMAGRNRGEPDPAWAVSPDPYIVAGDVRVLRKSSTAPADADWQLLRDIYTDAQLLDKGASSDVFETGNLVDFDSQAPVGSATGDRWRRFSCCVPLEPASAPPKVRDVLQDLLYQVGADLVEIYEPSKDAIRLRVLRRRPNPADSTVDHLISEGEFVTGDRTVVTRWEVLGDMDNNSAGEIGVRSAEYFREPIRAGAASTNVPDGVSDELAPKRHLSADFESSTFRSARDDERTAKLDAGRFWVPLEHIDGGGGFREGAQFMADMRQQKIRWSRVTLGFRGLRFDPGDTVRYLAQGLEELPVGQIRTMIERYSTEVQVKVEVVHASFFTSGEAPS